MLGLKVFREHLLHSRPFSGAGVEQQTEQKGPGALELIPQRELLSENSPDRRATLLFSHCVTGHPSCLPCYCGVTVRFLIVEHFHSVPNTDDL